jgi:hypothetical protein
MESTLAMRNSEKKKKDIGELYRILTKYYGIAAAYCWDLVSRLKIELDMYFPGGKHLCFVG